VKQNSTKDGSVAGLVSTGDLLPSERAFLDAMRTLGFGRFECLRIEHGAVVLEPWPTCVRDVKFCANWAPPTTNDTGFLLKPQVIEFFAYVREVDAGEIRELEVRHGLPFSMEIELQGGHRG